jgi:hypothetical protein
MFERAGHRRDGMDRVNFTKPKGETGPEPQDNEQSQKFCEEREQDKPEEQGNYRTGWDFMFD